MSDVLVDFQMHTTASDGAWSPQQIFDEIRMMVGDHFIEVFADCPLDICATRDGKVEMYAKAMRGEIKEFTGVSDPYEAPERPELHLHTNNETPEESADRVMRYLVEQGYVAAVAEVAAAR